MLPGLNCAALVRPGPIVNAAAAAGADPDGEGQNNQAEPPVGFLAGLQLELRQHRHE
jgi:hypothetical protein